MFRFEKFDVWQGAIEFADRLYAVSAKFPPVERLISQSHIGKRQSFMLAEDFQELYDRAERLSRMLSGLRSKLLGETR